MLKYKLSARQWIFAIAFALTLVLLRELSSNIFFIVWNTLILLYAILFAIFLNAEKYSFLYGLALIGLGIGIHWNEVNTLIEAGKCIATYDDHILNYLDQISNCLDYAERRFFYAQSYFIAGALIVVPTTINEIFKVYYFFKSEY
ncbi:hypothetical protein [Thalassotalea aquiviva]|uniref:hypothetical protein n=1 Tax=Thalassotalea aquiviva TaxID=3242415 RepID=UPI00352AEFCD